ncbi:hypothetical protein BJ971_006338 [Actinoplanes digitatis]|uniref:Uncharacterized protein n=1 Tax=Actinoplanes digitatis TaxID=1868 RepID=A0A7W7I3N3_9ACTN|nr:hypothetical protein [Actinoplanes digitatis]
MLDETDGFDLEAAGERFAEELGEPDLDFRSARTGSCA